MRTLLSTAEELAEALAAFVMACGILWTLLALG
jgi:hypothetical protein